MASPTRTAPQRPSAYAQLGGQRGVAALGVLVFHGYQYDRSGPASAYPYAGTLADTALRALDGLVDWFFVLSAFLLVLPYAEAALRGTRGTSPMLFLARRAVRIVPLYLVAVLVVWAFSVVLARWSRLAVPVESRVFDEGARTSPPVGIASSCRLRRRRSAQGQDGEAEQKHDAAGEQEQAGRGEATC